MFLHVFLFKWKPGASPAEQEQAAQRIVALKDHIPGILQASYMPNTSPRSQGYTHGGVMQFVDEAAFHAYMFHPVHAELVAWLMPLLESAAELDYTV